uniref:Ig-like domain-containing protein n=1 Tax=Ailuropoda melanoleuca TaxID=9646 RepID=A0A7N5K1V5_AILME
MSEYFSYNPILKGAKTQVRLVESGGNMKRPGESLRLSCKGSGFDLNDYDMGWTRQASGKGPEWISHINPSSSSMKYAENVKGRFTISRDNNNNELYLQMNDFKTEDEAIYYCVSYSNYGIYIFGKGTQVTISSDPPKAPSVFPLIPSSPARVARATFTDSKVTIGCLVEDYFPEPATVQWNSGAITSGIQDFPPVRHASGQYTHTSLLTIPASNWESVTYFCNIEHEATNSRINKYVGQTSRNLPTRINSYLLPPRPKHLYLDRNAKITCVVVNLEREEGLKISWSRKKRVLNKSKPT